jgi:hypothetical protein
VKAWHAKAAGTGFFAIRCKDSGRWGIRLVPSDEDDLYGLVRMIGPDTIFMTNFSDYAFLAERVPPSAQQRVPVAVTPSSRPVQPKADNQGSGGQRVGPVSRVIGKKNIQLGGKTACKIDFVYAGLDSEDLFWDGEACDAVTAEMVDQAALEKLGKWEKLDAFAQKHISGMPGGKVLYVEGGFTASVYPISTTQQSYEISVAD